MSSVEAETQGTWRQVAVVMDGKDIPVGRATLLIVADGNFTVTVNGKVYQKGTTKVDLSTSPRQSEAIIAQGPGAGKTLRQIGKVEGDVLIACAGPPDGERPTSFASPPGSGQTLSVWLRVKEADVPRFMPPTSNWQFWLFLFVAIGLLPGGEASRSLVQEPTLDYWGGVVLGGFFGAGILMGLCLLLKWGWRAGLTLGVSMSLALNTFEELKKAITPALGSFGALVVAASTAFVVVLIVGTLLARLLKLRW
jgi:uncharacterized protein (TIGR03067 family)